MQIIKSLDNNMLPFQATFLAFQDKLSSQPIIKRTQPTLTDFVIALFLTVLAVLVARWGVEELGTSLERVGSSGLWFQADTPRVIANLTDASSDHYRVAVHPIAPILLTSVDLGLQQLGMDVAFAAHFIIILSASLAAGFFFIFVRMLDLPRSVSIAFTLLFISSAAFLFWSPVEELNLPSMLTIVLALVALAYGRTRNTIWWVLMSSATLSITITNWSMGMIATLMRWSLRTFYVISTTALLIVCILATIQYMFYHHARPFFLGTALREELNYIQPARPIVGRWNPTDSLKSIFVSTIVAPTPVVEIESGESVVTNQKAGFFDRTLAGTTAAVAWLAVFCTGIWGGLRSESTRPVAVAIGLMVLSQAALHSIYGDPTFLYAPHFLPILIAVAALSWFTPVRWVAVSLTLVVAVLGGANNLAQFKVAADLAEQVISRGGNPEIPGFPAKGAVLP